jgi:hypothetical protein
MAKRKRRAEMNNREIRERQKNPLYSTEQIYYPIEDTNVLIPRAFIWHYVEGPHFKEQYVTSIALQ